MIELINSAHSINIQNHIINHPNKMNIFRWFFFCFTMLLMNLGHCCIKILTISFNGDYEQHVCFSKLLFNEFVYYFNNLFRKFLVCICIQARPAVQQRLIRALVLLLSHQADMRRAVGRACHTQFTGIKMLNPSLPLQSPAGNLNALKENIGVITGALLG